MSKRKTIKMTATQITEGEVAYISLVDKGANRTPFKALKREDDPMDASKNLDLGSMFRKKSEPQEVAPADLQAVVVHKSKAETVASVLGHAGIEVHETIEHEDGETVVLSLKADATGDDVEILKLANDEEVGLVVKHSKKMFQNWPNSDTPYMEAVVQTGFMPSVNIAMDVLNSKLWDLLDGTRGDNVASEIGSLIDEFKAYIVTLAGSLPVTAFKMERLKFEAEVTGDEPAADPEPEAPEVEPEKATVTKAEGAEAEPEEQDTTEPEATPEADPEADPETPADEPEAAPVDRAKADNSELVALLKSELGTISQAFEGLKNEVSSRLTAMDEKMTTMESTSREKQESVDQILGDLSEKSTKVSQMLGSTVAGDAGADPEDAHRAKSEPRPDVGLPANVEIA